ncbi:hypothetical protein OZ411_01360 [Bradyrhizobium sp. Arg237L]|uniref:hypothetical protein n=1 Tax=Bradyrhizobium sp. Arg237L TaxID=3003352 RepID=UPI00249EFC5E|nr:hypothetical protein [Bradyrhizobium sp. Arg237L]MDI4231461.1 hypothetical protein [Bradyrhizobium sp. Arg237L]
MAFIQPRDRVLEKSTSNSQSVFALAGAVDASFNRFSASMSVGDTTVGAVVEPGVAFKSGILTYTNTNEITVSVVFDSKGTFSPSGTKQVFMDLPAGLAFPKKNYIINGAMMVSQENGGVAGPGSAYYPVDMFACSAGTSGALTAGQVASATPAGSPNRLRLTVTGADTSVGSSDYAQIIHAIEGYRVADLRSGSSAAKTVTLKFGVKAPAGTYCVAFGNSAGNRSYVAEYTISAGEANTDVVKSVTLTLDTTGTWLANSGKGIDLRFFLMGGSSFQTATPNTWIGSAAYCTSNQFNFMGTNGNVFELFDVGLYEGSAAPAFQVPDFAAELHLCQRYWEKSYGMAAFAGSVSSADCIEFYVTFGIGAYQMPTVPFKVRKRAGPTIAFYPDIGGAAGTVNAVVAGIRAASLDTAGECGFSLFGSGMSAPDLVRFHYVANARL